MTKSSKRMRSFVGILLLSFLSSRDILVQGYTSTPTTSGATFGRRKLGLTRGEARVNHGNILASVVQSNNNVAKSQPLMSSSTQLSAAAAPLMIALPSTQTVALAALIPSCLGFYRSEYGVSYAYGTSVSLIAALVYRSISVATQSITAGSAAASLLTLASYHCFALMFYGIRLNLFLLYREIFLPKFREFREKIEDRAKEKGSRLARTPFIVSCAFLYACLCAPLFLTTSCLAEAESMSQPVLLMMKALVGCTWIGFLIGAVGDITKSIGKAQKGENALITSGVLKYLRHPNYTGETIGWTASCLAGLVACLGPIVSGGIAISKKQLFFPCSIWKTYVLPLVSSFVGWAGILFVLAQATTGLEKRQGETYGKSDNDAEREEYEKWVKNSYGGITLNKK